MLPVEDGLELLNFGRGEFLILDEAGEKWRQFPPEETAEK